MTHRAHSPGLISFWSLFVGALMAYVSWSSSTLAAPECEFGQGQACSSSADCADNEVATLCASSDGQDGRCEVPCVSGNAADPASCSMGETCVAGVEPGLGGGDTFYCQASKFSMDLNLLDACVYHFLEGLAPDLSTDNQCSLISNLNQMLDQDGNRTFNIYDVDLCVHSFLGEEACDASTSSCPDGQVYCTGDAECGEGLYCDPDLNKCSRDCGFVVSRQSQSLVDSIDRACAGTMKSCDYSTGRCVDVDPAEASCQVDQDCPSGAYCFLGQCAPRCYRSLDCPGAQWYCSATNKCEPTPKAGEDEAFNPRNYSVQFSQDTVDLNPVQNSFDVPLLLMDLKTKRQVFDQDNAVFGYRLEITYGKKQDQKCLGDLGELSSEEADDCYIDEDEEFIKLASPFGTIYGSNDPTLGVSVNEVAADKLSPGLYQATLRAIFSNGNSSTMSIRFKKPSPSGEYSGRVSVYHSVSISGGTPKNWMGTTNLAMRLFIDKSKVVKWSELLAANNVAAEEEFTNLTQGYQIKGYIHGGSSMIFNQPSARSDTENEIPIVGLYAPSLRQMRIIGVVDYGANFAQCENGKCSNTEGEMRAENVFRRKIRRTMEFIGPFNDTLNRFEGVFREKFSGLVPFDFTLDGGFVLNQIIQDESPITLGPLQSSPSGVSFPSSSTLQQQVDSEVALRCDASTANKVSSKSAFTSYMNSFTVNHIYPNLTQFESLIANALAATNNGSAPLTMTEFLEGELEECDGSTTTAPCIEDGELTQCEVPVQDSCIDRAGLQCGLALYRKALVRGWVDYSDIGVSSGSATLFCGGQGVPGQSSDCPWNESEEPAVVALQEHNRFYRQLVQLLSYEAGGAAREAFFTMFRAARGDELDESSAYAHKDRLYRQALSSYDDIRDVVFSPASTDVLFDWPMVYFGTRGSAWIKQLHSTIEARMQTLIEAMDHRRRVLKSGNQNDHLFAQHTLHQEYLQQVFLMALEKHWEEELFSYAGQTADLIESGDRLLAKTKDSRNPLGLHPNRIYFENSDLASQNWQNFRNRLHADLGLLQQDVQEAVQSMEGSLQSRQAFENSLLGNQQQLRDTLDSWCGEEAPEVALPGECSQSVSDKMISAAECVGPSCDYEYKCDDENCSEVAAHVRTQFNLAIAEAEGKNACRVDAPHYKITDVDGSERSCVRGRIGALMQERVSLDLQLEQTSKNVKSLMRQINRQEQFIAESMSQNAELIDYLEDQRDLWTGIDSAMGAADLAYQVGITSAEGLDCMIIVGLANGTNCPQKAASQAIKATVVGVYNAAKIALNVARSNAAANKEIHLREDANEASIRGMRMQLDNMITQVENYIATYEAVAQQIFNIEQQVVDGLYQAQQASKRYREQNDQIFSQLEERLTGSVSGNVLTTNEKVADANARFEKMLIEAYKMTRAFIHRFNLSSQAEAWSNRVYEIVTVQDLEDFIAFLDGVEQNYCGAEGLDCDYINNGEVFEYSVQKQLFPNLRDIVNPSTGQVLTVGQQFHDIITSSTFVKRRARPYGMVEQIELPFAVWLNDRGEAGNAPQRYMVGPGDCNHIIRGKDASGGTVAVNVIGTRIPKSPGVKFELWRGNTDYIRSCTEKQSEFESAINTYIVGWTPSSSLGQLDNPPSFFTQSGELSACINNHLLGDPSTVDSQDGCFRFFARDRSLGAPDYTFVIPQIDRDQEWLLGDGLSKDERPVIEDIVLYFRYNDRPITLQ